jgi:hypothetical protein
MAVGLGIPGDPPGRQPEGPSRSRAWISTVVERDPHETLSVLDSVSLYKYSLHNNFGGLQMRCENKSWSCTYRMGPGISDRVSLLGYGPTVESTLVYLVAVEQLIRVVVRCSQNLLASVAAVVVVVVVLVDVFVAVVVVVVFSARYQRDPHVEADARKPAVAHTQARENGQVVLDSSTMHHGSGSDTIEWQKSHRTGVE